MEKARAAFTNGRIWGTGPAVLPTGLSGRATPKSCSGSLYAAEPKWWFTDTQCNVTFISVVAIIARVVWEACRALGPDIPRTAFRKKKSLLKTPAYLNFSFWSQIFSKWKEGMSSQVCALTKDGFDYRQLCIYF